MEDTNTEIKLKENENKDSNLIKIQLEETKSNNELENISDMKSHSDNNINKQKDENYTQNTFKKESKKGKKILFNK